MSGYYPREGDQITLDHPDGSRLVRTVVVSDEPAIPVRGDESVRESTYVSWLLNQGWKITNHPVRLPTIAGIYVSYVKTSPTVVHKLNDGRWVDANDANYLTDDAIHALMPLVRLIPEAVSS